MSQGGFLVQKLVVLLLSTFFLGFETQATWLRIDNDTSPVLEHL